MPLRSWLYSGVLRLPVDEFIHSVPYPVGRGSAKLAKWRGDALALFAITDVGDHRYDPEEIPLGLTDLGAWAWMDQRGRSDILLVAPMLGALAYDSLSGISGVTISNGVVLVKLNTASRRCSSPSPTSPLFASHCDRFEMGIKLSK